MAKTSEATLFIVAAPSGGGKTSLVKHLISSLSNIDVSISHTTRDKRPGEQEGVDYFFVSDDQFQCMINNHEFIEHAEVFGCFYGTSIQQIEQRLAAGTDIVLDIDWQGAQQIKTLFSNSVSIFIIPPSLETLMQRLQGRGQDKADIINYRMKKAHDELAHHAEFDYLVVNDDFHQAALELKAIVQAARLSTNRQVKKFAKLLSLLLVSK